MKTKPLLVFSTVACAFAVVPVLTGCDSGGTDIDTSKTQIYVNNFCRGFGGEWLTSYKKSFEKLHENDSYEDGKKGVQIFITNSNAPAESRMDNIRDGRDEVYFTEQTDYYVLLQNDVIGDLTNCVTEKISGESRSILDKMSSGQKNFLNVDGKYYAIPHYSGYFGLTYDVDLFDKKLLYFNEDRTDFIISKDEKKSVGPDGISGTSDDGLPITYEEFYKLCDFMLDNKITPIVSTGQSAGGYINLLVNSAATQNIGFEQMNLIYSCDGKLTNLVEISGDEVVDIDDVTLTPENGYMSFHQKGKYEAIKFYETLYTGRNGKRYILDKIDSPSYSAGTAQDDFLCSNISGAAGDLKPIGMISEGNWWVNEASGTFEQLSQTYGEQYSKQNRNLAFMPLPKATESSDHTNTIYDHLSALCFVKKGIEDWKMPLIEDFVQFCNSDESLVLFSTITNTMKALDYEIPEDKLATMNTYGKSLYDLQRSAEIVYPYNNTKFFQNNSSIFKYTNLYYSKINGINNQYVYQGIKNGATANEYFKGMYEYFEEDWKNRSL